MIYEEEVLHYLFAYLEYKLCCRVLKLSKFVENRLVLLDQRELQESSLDKTI